MAYSRFTISGELNAFETVDFVANLPIAAKHGPIVAVGRADGHCGDCSIL